MMSDGRYRQVGHGTVGSRTANRDMAVCRFLEGANQRENR